jgi:hypothetical protein
MEGTSRAALARTHTSAKRAQNSPGIAPVTARPIPVTVLRRKGEPTCAGSWFMSWTANSRADSLPRSVVIRSEGSVTSL